MTMFADHTVFAGIIALVSSAGVIVGILVAIVSEHKQAPSKPTRHHA